MVVWQTGIGIEPISLSNANRKNKKGKILILQSKPKMRKAIESALT